jgi:hypothetical protein
MKIQVHFDPRGRYGGKAGCFRAKVVEKPGYHSAGRNVHEAIDELFITIRSCRDVKGCPSKNPKDYEYDIVDKERDENLVKDTLQADRLVASLLRPRI